MTMTRLMEQLSSRCLCVFVLVALPACALKHSFRTFVDGRTLIGPVGAPFGFLAGGTFQLNVFNFELTGPDKDAVHAGFYLHSFVNEAAYYQFIEAVRFDGSQCIFESFLDDDSHTDNVLVDDVDDVVDVNPEITSVSDGIPLLMNRLRWLPAEPAVNYTFVPGEEGLYVLTYQVCPAANVQSTFELDFSYQNRDALGRSSYLGAGEIHLPMIFAYFSISYAILSIIWITNLYSIGSGGIGHFSNTATSGRPVVYRIHHLMSILLVFKFLSLLFESIRYRAIRVSGHAELWSVLYYAVSAVKGIFLFTVLLLIGTGWSFVKPYLNPREKKVVFCILLLQAIDNIALVALSQEAEGENSYQQWTAILHLVDIICCCTVLIPIVWQVNALEKGAGLEEDENVEDALELGEKGEILSKLRLFRTFYLLVVAYIYSTRVLIYLFVTTLSYQHLWIRYFVIELVTLAFYAIVGSYFRPVPSNTYASVQNECDVCETGILLTGDTAKAKIVD